MLKLQAMDLRHVVDKVAEDERAERLTAENRVERLEQALATQDQRASAMMRTTEAVLSNELNQTSESIDKLKDAIDTVTFKAERREEESDGHLQDVVRRNVERVVSSEIGKVKSGYLLELEQKMDHVISGLHMPRSNSPDAGEVRSLFGSPRSR